MTRVVNDRLKGIQVADHEPARDGLVWDGLVRELSGWSAGIAGRIRAAQAEHQNAGRR